MNLAAGNCRFFVLRTPLLPVETAPGTARSTLALISAARAATLKLANQREAADGHAPVLIRAAEPLDLASARPIADPALDLVAPLKGPFAAEHLDWSGEAAVAMELARIAGILPAFLVAPEPAGEPVVLAVDDLVAFLDPARLAIAARARLPVAACEDAEVVIFRSPDDTREHVALIVGRQSSDSVPLVRLHSECLTGDLLGSLRCDCGPQLGGALAAMAEKAGRGGWGVLLYLRQEGRGIGLVNKLRAYELQDDGFDTIDANEQLGFDADERIYAPAATMLSRMGIKRVRLMTNNPEKISQLERYGIEVAERVAHAFPANGHNENYLRTKAERAGHLL